MLKPLILALQSLLIHGGYAVFVGLHALLIVVLAFRRAGKRGRERSVGAPRGHVLAWGSGVAVVALVARFAYPPAPQVCFDEFYYLATARHLVSSATLTPYLQSQGGPLAGQATQGRTTGFAIPTPQPASPQATPNDLAQTTLGEGAPRQPINAFDDVLPPYPQGWPCMLALLHALPSDLHGPSAWDDAVVFNRLLGVATACLGFAVLAGESLAGALYLGLALAVLPPLLRQTCGASAEGAALAWVLVAWAAVRSQRRAPSPAGAWLAVALVAWTAHFRPENGLYGLLLLPWLETARPDWRKGLARGAGFALGVLPDAILVLGGSYGHFAGDHFRAIPRPGFVSMAANTWANLGNNLLFLVDGRLLPWYVTPLALGGAWTLWRTARRDELALYLAWPLLFVLALSPFPFGDLAAAHSFDTWRFSYHVALPWLIMGAVGVEAFLAWAERRGAGLERAGYGALLGALLTTPYTCATFLNRPHPLAPLWTLVQGCAHTTQQGRVLTHDRELALALQEAFGLQVSLADTSPPQGLKAEGSPPSQNLAYPPDASALYLCESDGDLHPAWEGLPFEPVRVLRAYNPTQTRTRITILRWRGP